MANQNNKANSQQQFTYKRRNYTNSIPIAQLACPVKFLNLSFQNIERYAKCQITKLEEDYKWEVWPEEIFKHCPPLVDLNIFKRDENAVLDEKDALLLEDDFAVQSNSKRSQQHSKIVPWMRKTEYISTEFNRYGANSDRSENKVGYNMKKKMGNQDNLFKDQASQIEAIKKTFTDAAKPVKRHYSKPGVHAVEEIMLLPDEEQSKFSYAQVIFDADPLPSTKESSKLQERAVLKGMKDQDGNNFVAYFVPSEETLAQKLTEEGESINYTPGYEYKYTCGREYNWTVHTKQSHGPDVEAYFFTQRNGVMYYCEVDTRVKLNRRVKMSATSRHSMLLLSHREYTEDELKGMERRKNKLYDPYITGEYIPLNDEEEEEDDEVADQESETEEQKTETKEEADKQEARSEKSSDSSSDSDQENHVEAEAKTAENGNQSDFSSSSQSSQSS